MICARGFEKRYGQRRALSPFDFDFGRGGFLVVTGANGSGKTTLLRLVAGLAVPTRGEVEVEATCRQLGFVGHELLLYGDLTVFENFDLYGRFYRVLERPERIGMLFERFGLWDVRSERVAFYSRGMIQRLVFCRVLLHEPELLVLDEPFTALDSEGAGLLDRQLAELAGVATVLLLTHDAERVAPLASARLALA